MFIDDNPIECAEVRSGCPSVLTLQWPLDEQLANRFLDHLWEFDVYSTTNEDRKRTQLYKQEFLRQEVKSKSDNFQQFLDSLELRVDCVRFQRMTWRGFRSSLYEQTSSTLLRFADPKLN